jgi:hypothetical protein
MSVERVTLLVLSAQAIIYALMLWQMIKTAKATTKAAEAATRAVAFTERTYPITERALVLVESVIATPQGGGASGIGLLVGESKVVFILKNFGRTVAKNVKFTGVLKIDGLGTLRTEEFPLTIIAPQGSNSWNTRPIRHLIGDDEATLLQLINLEGLRDTSLETTLEYGIDVTYSDAFGEYRYHCEGRYEPTLKRFLITGSTSD